MRTFKEHYKRVYLIHRPLVRVMFSIVKTKIRHTRKAIQFHHSSATTFTCLALESSLLEVENEELGKGFKNTKQEVQKTQM